LRSRGIAPPSLDAIVTIFLALAGWHGNLNPISDNSTFCHLRTGQWMLVHGLPRVDIFSFTAAGTPWVPESWLADFAYGALDRAVGPVGLILFHAAIGATIGALWYRLARRIAHDTFRATMISVVSLAATYTLWSPRPLMLGILAFLVLVYIVELPDSAAGRRPMLLIPPLFWLWANTHGSFVLGFAYLALHLIGRRLDGATQSRGRERELLIAAAVALAVCFINPYGYRLLIAPFHLAARYRALSGVVEWRHASIASVQGVAYIVWIAVFSAAILTRPREIGIRGFVVALPFLALGLWAERNIAIAPIATFPIVARAWAAPAETATNRRAFNWAMAVLAAVLAIAWTVPVFRRPGLNFAGYPVAALRSIAARGLLGSRLLSTDAWGGYIVLNYGPQQRVFMDDRYDVYPQNVTIDLSDLLNKRGNWPQTVRKYGIDVVVWPAADRSVDTLGGIPGWKKIFQDREAVVFSNR
jgi:hypothetical protein